MNGISTIGQERAKARKENRKDVLGFFLLLVSFFISAWTLHIIFN